MCLYWRKNKLLSCDFTGNIGNHTFQYAITRTVAEKNGYEWGFNPITSNDYYGGRPQMDFCDINYGKQHTAKWKEIPEGITNIWEEKREHLGTHEYHHYQPDIFNVPDNTKFVISCCQDARYFDKEKLRQWFKIKDENIKQYNKILQDNNIVLDENLTVINIRGGEYKGIGSLLLPFEYWSNAIKYMSYKNPKMKYLVITDDVEYAKTIFGFPIAHFGIGMDYFVIRNAKNSILSNSSFAILPSWLNLYDPYVIAPKGWARHNLGIWASSDIWTFGFNFLDREGKLFTAEECEKENIQ
jgi:hypothetical protein